MVRMAWCDVAVGDVEGALVVVDTGDMGVRWSGVVVGQLSWFVGGRGCLWWWRLCVGDVVAGGGCGGGCGMKKEAVSPFVMCVTFGSRTCARSRSCSCSCPNSYHIQFYSIYYTIL